MKSKCHVARPRKPISKRIAKERAAQRAATVQKEIARAASALGLGVYPSRCGGHVVVRNGRRVAYYDRSIGVELIDSPGVRHKVAGIGEALHYVAQRLAEGASRA